MAKKSSRNNDLLNSVKAKTSPKIYDLLVELVNDDREDLAEIVIKVDFLLEYASNCIKQKDLEEAKESLQRAKSRIDKVKAEGGDTAYLEYLYEGIEKKAKL